MYRRRLGNFEVDPFRVCPAFHDLGDEAKPRMNELLAHLKAQGILATGLYRLRFVTHLDVDSAGVERAIVAIRQFFRA